MTEYPEIAKRFARDKIRHAMTEPNAWGHYTPETAAQLLNAYRAEVLREAADVAEHFMARFPEMDDAKKAGVIGPFTAAGGIAEELRRMADAGKATRGNSQPTAGESTQTADLHTVIHEAIATFQSRAHNGGYYQQLTAHLVEAVAPLVPYREVWDSGLPPGGLCCSVCGQPVESEPCPDHAPLTPARPQLAGQQVAGAVLDDVTNGGDAE